jgi:hypothetical protein
MSDNVEIECVDLLSDDSDHEDNVLEDSVYSSEDFIEGKVHFQILRKEESLAGWEVRFFFNILFSFFLFLGGKNCHPLPPYTASIPPVHLKSISVYMYPHPYTVLYSIQRYNKIN